MRRKFFFVLFFLLFATVVLSYRAHAQTRPPGCGSASEFLKVAEVYALDGSPEATEIRKQMQDVRTRACRGDFTLTQTVKYQNGRVATLAAGDPAISWSWPNGTLITNSPGSSAATVYYPNGNIVSAAFRTLGTNFNYPSGMSMTTEAGIRGEKVDDMTGVTATSDEPDFAVNGELNTEKFLGYVLELNAKSIANSANSSAKPIK
jgi:hypothetical protein